MDFVRGWRPSAGGECSQRGAPRAASASPPDATAAGLPRIAVTDDASAAAPISARSRLVRLKIRADFLGVAGSRMRAAMPGLLLQAAPRSRRAADETSVRVGFTASRKVGNAVVRNRVKRRLRAAASEVLPGAGRPGTDYVLVARAATVDRPYRALVEDLQRALRRVERDLRERTPRAGEEE
jgi:ribonuclease P protein component